MIRYVHTIEGLRPEQLQGFFEGWPHPPSPETHLRLLQNSQEVVLALDKTGAIVGFVTALSDGVLSAFIPLLEVLPAHRNQGIGSELLRRMIERLSHLYMTDVVCDAALLPFYERAGMRPMSAAGVRRYERQDGA